MAESMIEDKKGPKKSFFLFIKWLYGMIFLVALVLGIIFLMSNKSISVNIKFLFFKFSDASFRQAILMSFITGILTFIYVMLGWKIWTRKCHRR